MMRKIDTEIQFSSLKSGKYKYSYKLDESFFSEFKNEDLREGDVDFEVHLEKTERTMLFTFSFSGTVKSKCDRCLGEIDVPVRGEQVLCVKLSDTETSDNEDVLILPENAYKLDLAQWMYEYVVVALPLRVVHEESECDPEMLKYLTEEGETEREEGESVAETDPRWEVLRQLRDEK